MDIGELRLTAEECEKLRPAYGEYGLKDEERLCEAQLGKALWGVVDWLKNPRGQNAPLMAYLLGKKLRAAGVERPKGVA